VPDGHRVDDAESVVEQIGDDLDPEHEAMGAERLQFRTDFLQHLKLDDPEQPLLKASKSGRQPQQHG